MKNDHACGTPYEDIAYIAFTRAELVKFMCDPDATKHALVYLNARRKNQLLSESSDEEIIQEISKLDSAVNNLLDAPEGEQEGTFIKMLEAVDDDDEVYEHLIDMAKNRENFDDMLEYCTLFETYGSDQTYKRMKFYPGVVLTTAHSSKGKEWPVVINTLNNYHIKEIGRKLNCPDFEERRRLLFVSATRAKRKLYLVGQEVAYGSKKNEDQTLNQFLIESCEAANTPFPSEPQTEKKTKERRNCCKRNSIKYGRYVFCL